MSLSDKQVEALRGMTLSDGWRVIESAGKQILDDKHRVLENDNSTDKDLIRARAEIKAVRWILNWPKTVVIEFEEAKTQAPDDAA